MVYDQYWWKSDKLNVNAIQTESYVQLFVSDALGNIVYFNTSADSIIVGDNTYENAALGKVITNGFLNAGTLKTVQKLNIDDFIRRWATVLNILTTFHGI